MLKTELTPEALHCYESAGNILKKVRASLAGRIKSGARLLDIAEHVERETIRHGGFPAFPCNISINQIASHYTPSKNDGTAFIRGDLVKIDLGISVEGYIADAAFTIEVETRTYNRLIDAAQKALYSGIDVVRPGIDTCDIGRSIDMAVMAEGYRVVRGLYGHNLGRYCLHGGLTIPNYDTGPVAKIREGDVLAIEPFLTTGNGKVVSHDEGDIYQLIRKNPIYAGNERERLLLEEITQKYGCLPFAERWLPDSSGLTGLVKSAVVKRIPVLISEDDCPVAQMEHTVIVEHDGCKIIT